MHLHGMVCDIICTYIGYENDCFCGGGPSVGLL